MTILVLEDDVERVKWFRRKFKRSMVIAQTAQVAKVFLRTVHFDIVYLDCDIVGGTENGQDVAYEMAHMPKSERPRRVIIHSTSIKGSYGIFTTLKNAGYTDVVQKPFPPF